MLTRDLTTAGERSEFFSRVRAGEFVSVLRGAYVRTDVWRAVSPDGRYLLRIAAAAELEPSSIYSHESAAAIWRLPSVAGWPSRVHVLHPGGDVRSTTSAFVRHLFEGPSELVVIDGRRVTDLARTVIDIAATRPFAFAVAMADAALRRTTHPIPGMPTVGIRHDELVRELERVPMRHGSARARKAILFADGAADRPGESVSRCSMAIARVTMPRLQVVLYGASGARYVVDFWWPEFNEIGEFDGKGKYRDPEFLRGRTPEQALLDEKFREDDLRQAGYGMTRWGWTVASDPARLKAHLALSGVR